MDVSAHMLKKGIGTTKKTKKKKTLTTKL